MSSHKRDRERERLICVRVQPTIGPSFELTLSPSTTVSGLKESISDKMGLSPQKMTLLFRNQELQSGSLQDNSVDDGCEVRLVPAVESGVTAANSVDPVAMMKHSMSGISDQQIDDFLNGKSPLSVAIRVGESVVVVNLHRAKVEEIDVEPPPSKRRCVHARRLSEDSIDSEPSTPSSSLSSPSPSSSPLQGARHLNTNSSFRGDRSRDSCDSPPSRLFDQPLADELSSSTRSSSPSRPATLRAETPLSSRLSRVEPLSPSSPLSPSIATSPAAAESKPEVRLTENGISMKRKAVMEAISEILRKMYASSEKGRLPGSFKGRFSSEFTCDSDMQEILHSKTTMTSYGTEEGKNWSGQEAGGSGTLSHDSTHLSKAKREEHEHLKYKVAKLRWKMQHSRAKKMAKRRGERSPCGWIEALNCKSPGVGPPNPRDQTAFCGMKRGFLVAD